MLSFGFDWLMAVPCADLPPHTYFPPHTPCPTWSTLLATTMRATSGCGSYEASSSIQLAARLDSVSRRVTSYTAATVRAGRGQGAVHGPALVYTCGLKPCVMPQCLPQCLPTAPVQARLQKLQWRWTHEEHMGFHCVKTNSPKMMPTAPL